MVPQTQRDYRANRHFSSAYAASTPSIQRIFLPSSVTVASAAKARWGGQERGLPGRSAADPVSIPDRRPVVISSLEQTTRLAG